MSRIDVKKTYKLYINGAFPRSESGRVYEVKNSKGAFIANPALASRKDLRDSVVAARGAFSKWSGSTSYLRGQIIYGGCDRSAFVTSTPPAPTNQATWAKTSRSPPTWCQ